MFEQHVSLRHTFGAGSEDEVFLHSGDQVGSQQSLVDGCGRERQRQGWEKHLPGSGPERVVGYEGRREPVESYGQPVLEDDADLCARLKLKIQI